MHRHEGNRAGLSSWPPIRLLLVIRCIVRRRQGRPGARLRAGRQSPGVVSGRRAAGRCGTGRVASRPDERCPQTRPRAPHPARPSGTRGLATVPPGRFLPSSLQRVKALLVIQAAGAGLAGRDPASRPGWGLMRRAWDPARTTRPPPGSVPGDGISADTGISRPNPRCNTPATAMRFAIGGIVPRAGVRPSPPGAGPPCHTRCGRYPARPSASTAVTSSRSGPRKSLSAIWVICSPARTWYTGSPGSG